MTPDRRESVCSHVLRIWRRVGAADAKPWAVRYVPAELPCALAGQHDEHRVNALVGKWSWR